MVTKKECSQSRLLKEVKKILRPLNFPSKIVCPPSTYLEKQFYTELPHVMAKKWELQSNSQNCGLFILLKILEPIRILKLTTLLAQGGDI